MKNLLFALFAGVTLVMASCATTSKPATSPLPDKKGTEVSFEKQARPLDMSDLKGLTLEEIKKIQFYNSDEITLSRINKNMSKSVEGGVLYGLDSNETVIKKISKGTPGRPVSVDIKNGVAVSMLISFSAEDKDLRFWFFAKPDGYLMESGKNGQIERLGGIKYNLSTPAPNICKLMLYDGVKRGTKTISSIAEGDPVEN